MGRGHNPSVRAEVLCCFSRGVCVTVIKKPLTHITPSYRYGRKMIFADMFSPSDTRFSPSCDPPDGTFSPNLSDLRDEGQLNENRLARVPAINSLALLRDSRRQVLWTSTGDTNASTFTI